MLFFLCKMKINHLLYTAWAKKTERLVSVFNSLFQWRTNIHTHTHLIRPLQGGEPRKAYLSFAICLCLVGGPLLLDWLIWQATSLLIGLFLGNGNLWLARPWFYFLIFIIPNDAPSAMSWTQWEKSATYTRPCTLASGVFAVGSVWTLLT